MKEFKDKIAAITGAASGIGHALVEKCLEKDMKVVMADIQERKLRRFERKLKKQNQDVIAVPVDVTKYEQLERLKKTVLDTYGKIHLLFNNAGVGMPKKTWNLTLNDWRWVIDVNLFGVIHGIRAFLPLMLEQDFKSLIVNTSSLEGLMFGCGPGGPAYGATKHAVVSLTESLKRELSKTKSKVDTCVVCPGWVQTGIFKVGLTRQEEYKDDEAFAIDNSQLRASADKYKDSKSITPPISSETAAERILQQIQEGKFYILTQTDEAFKKIIKDRMQGILDAFD